jgi:branched-subunit amino acid aminotransferase/4-amino-4-deoxychorismate lyase
MANPVAYFNGEWTPGDGLRLPVDDLGFVLGATIVERMRTFQRQVFRLQDHLQRLRRSLEVVGWDAPRLVAEVGDALDGFLRRNAGLISAGDDWSLTAFITPGRTPDAAQPTVCVFGLPLPFADWAYKFDAGVEVVIVDVRQVPDNCWPSELKCRSRLHYYLADRQAAARAPGARALLLDQDGFVGEASTANVIAHFADRGLVTPPREKVLPGISQRALFELADSLNLPHAERNLTPAELAAADEVFLTSTSVCVLPVVRIDGQPVGQGTPGPVFRRLLAAWGEHVGVDIAAQAARFAHRGA